MNTRRVELKLTYNSKDISADLKPYLSSWTHSDVLSGQADDLQISLIDKDKKWIGPWLPDVGATLLGSIVRSHWEKVGKVDTVPLGQFEIDTVDVSFPPSRATIKAISVPESSSIRGEEKNRAWEETRLSVIARDISGKNKLQLFYDVEEDPEYDRIEQTGETDLSFLMRLCGDAGFALKVTGDRLVIVDEAKYEQRPPSATFTPKDIDSFQGSITTTGTYRAARVEYYDGRKKKKVAYSFTPGNAPKTGRTLYINQRVSSYKEAMRLAKKRLRKANQEATTVSFTKAGEILLFSGLTIKLSGFGAYDGKYIITSVQRTYQDGLETSVELRKCLEGY